jgi:putative hydrolase of the HAD superfamily
VNITFVWFDLGYTLLYWTFARSYHAVLAEQGHEVARDLVERAYHVADKLFMREYPGVFGGDPDTFSPWFLGVLNHRLGIRTDLCRAWQRLKEVLATERTGWLPFDGVAEALADLRRRGYRLGIITNWDPSARRLLAHHGLDGFFERVVVSSEVGYEKPDRRIFEIAVAAAGVSPYESLYVGDNYYLDTVGARAAGMASVVVNRFGRLGVEEITDAPIIAGVGELAGWLEQQRD